MRIYFYKILLFYLIEIYIFTIVLIEYLLALLTARRGSMLRLSSRLSRLFSMIITTIRFIMPTKGTAKKKTKQTTYDRTTYRKYE